MLFSFRQLQEKCREQRRPMCIAFVDLTKTVHFVSRSGLFKLLNKISTVNYNGATPRPVEIRYGVKQGCILAPMFLGTFVSMMLSSAFDLEDVYLHTRTGGKLLTFARLKANDSSPALATQTEEYLQKVMERFSHVCKKIGCHNTTINQHRQCET